MTKESAIVEKSECVRSRLHKLAPSLGHDIRRNLRLGRCDNRLLAATREELASSSVRRKTDAAGQLLSSLLWDEEREHYPRASWLDKRR